MSVRVSIDSSDIEKVAEKRIESMDRRMGDLEPVLKGRAATLDTLIKRTFNQSKSPFGFRWRRLKRSTIKRKGSNKPLVDTGALKLATYAKASGSKIMYGVAGAPARYASVHQFGHVFNREEGEVEVPARPFLPTDQSGKASFHAGPAAKWYDRMMARVRAYILTGKK